MVRSCQVHQLKKIERSNLFDIFNLFCFHPILNGIENSTNNLTFI